jgi:hypothetical protein
MKKKRDQPCVRWVIGCDDGRTAMVNETFFDVDVSGGKYRIIDERTVAKLVAMLKDGRYTAHLQRINDRRSSAQNRMYFGLAVKTLSEYTGYTREEIHEFLKVKFNPQTIFICNANGEIVDEKEIGGTTRFLSKIEMGDMFERIQVFAAEAGCVIPDPGRY